MYMYIYKTLIKNYTIYKKRRLNPKISQINSVYIHYFTLCCFGRKTFTAHTHTHTHTHTHVLYFCVEVYYRSRSYCLLAWR